MKRPILMLFSLAALLLAGCSGQTVDPDTPPQIAYGEDVCAHCGMIISDERFAAGVVVEPSANSFEHLVFDDIGDMFAYVRKEGLQAQVVSYFVHDYNSRAWIDARTAHFVRTDTLLTPMGSGLVAFADRVEAESQAQVWQAAVLDFASVQELSMDANAMGHMHAH